MNDESSMTALDMRFARRYQIAAPVDYWWSTPMGSVHSNHGLTHDISNNGVLIMTADCPPPGVHIQMTIFVSRRHDETRRLELHGEGTVVRVLNKRGSTETNDISNGFAATAQFYPELPNDAELGRRSTSGS